MRTRIFVIILAFLGSLLLAFSVTPASAARPAYRTSTIQVNIRRNTNNGLPYGGAHSAGIGQIVWGYAPAGAHLTIQLKHGATLLSTCSLVVNIFGQYSISLDRAIEDGDTVLVSDGSTQKTILVPVMSYTVDNVARQIHGVGPANISSTAMGAPHTLQIFLAGTSRAVTTDGEGDFLADFSDRPFLAGLLGSMQYITPEGDSIYKPLFAMDPFARGQLGDGWADVVLGKQDFTGIVFNEVNGQHLFNPQGVLVDRSVHPNRVYVYDAGNSRVLGLSHLGVCLSGVNAQQDCTTDSDCPASACQIQADRRADIVLGQPSFTTSKCNGDSGYQLYPDVPLASAASFCGLREEQMSVSEGGSGTTMAVDPQGNLYVPDFFNNRILRYDNPFTHDQIADAVWGQEDFSGIFCNEGGGYGSPNAKSLCLAAPPGVGDGRAGIAIDAAGNLWVGDGQNNRVLRFPTTAGGLPAKTADLVLGQADFTSGDSGSGLNRMHNPASVQVAANGTVYVADSLNNRVLVFDSPQHSGMNATRVISSGIDRPTGLGLDPSGGLWVNDNGHDRFVHYVNEVAQQVITGVDEEGGLGVDRDGNVFSAGWALQGVKRHTGPTYSSMSVVFGQTPDGLFNTTTASSLYGGMGLEIAGGQLIASDESRLLFWNGTWNLSNNQPANGVIGAPDLNSRQRWGQRFTRMRADGHGKLWVLYRDNAEVNYVVAYALPLTNGASPIVTLSSPLPLLGGGTFTWTRDIMLGGIDVQSDCDCLWLSDEGNNRVFRIRNASTAPVVDAILGQANATETGCNQGAGRDLPSAGSLCHPGALSFDENGNLFVADHNLEFDGNLRLLEWNRDSLPQGNASLITGVSAARVFGRGNSFTEPNCLNGVDDPLCGPWEPAFNGQGRMALGQNGYLGSRFPLIYENPLTNPFPIGALGDFYSMAFSMTYDQYGNLYTIDINRSRILIYLNQKPLQIYLPLVSK